MAMGPTPEGAPEQSGGGASQLFADTNSNLMKIQEMLSSKFPEDGEKMAQVVQAFQAVVDGLGQAPGQAPAEAPGTGTTTPEQGAAPVKPVY
jgi:hypothetical protein